VLGVQYFREAVGRAMTAESRHALEKRRIPMLACTRCGRPAYYDIEANDVAKRWPGNSVEGGFDLPPRSIGLNVRGAMRPDGMTALAVDATASDGFSPKPGADRLWRQH